MRGSMIKKAKKRIIWLAGACAAIATVGAVWGIASNAQASMPVDAQEGEVVLAEELKGVYSLGENLQLGQGSIVHNNQLYFTQTAYLTYPSGEIFYRESYTLEQIGKYAATYTATTPDGLITAQKEFFVYQPSYSGSKITYEFREQLNMKEDEASGLGLKIDEGGKFEFNHAVDISTYTSSDALFTIYPYSRTALMGQNGETHETRKVFVRLTDCYDPSIYLEFSFSWGKLDAKKDPNDTCVYVRAGSSHQTTMGLVAASTPHSLMQSIWYNGSFYRGDSRVEYGTQSRSRKVHERNADNAGFSMCYDYETQEIYFEDRGGRIFVNDLDAPEIYGENLFKGFTTGEVYFSLWGDEYETATMNIEIEKIGDYVGEDFKALEVVDDKQAPVVLLDEIWTSAPSIYVAKNDEVRVPTANPRDLNGVSAIMTKVYKNYGTPTQKFVSLSQDNTFIAKEIGIYTVEYTATDVFGNKGIATLSLNALEVEGNQTVCLQTEALTELSAGQNCVLPDYTLSGVNGGEYVRMFAIYNGQAEELDTEYREFFVNQVGEYEILYLYGDPYNSYSYRYKVMAKPSDNVKISLPLLPTYFIKGMPYTLEDNVVRLFGGETATETVSTVLMKMDNGEFEPVQNYEKVVVMAESTVQFRYAYGDAYVDSQVIPVVDVNATGALNVKEYFYGNFTKEATAGYVHYTSNVAAGENQLDFINAIGLSKFSLDFSISTAEANYDSLSIILSNYDNREEQIVITYGKDGENGYFQLNDGLKNPTGKSFSDFAVSLTYSARAGAFITNTDTNIQCNSLPKFERILFSIRFNDIDGDAGICISSVGNQGFTSNISKDRIKATVAFDEVYGEYQMGATVTVYPATITDVLSPYLREKFEFYAVSPSGKTVVSVDNVEMKVGCPIDRAYTFKIEEYGIYYITYSYKDFSNNNTTINVPITILETTPPSLTINGYAEGAVQEAKLNTKISVAGYTAVDNETPTDELQVQVVVWSPKGEVVPLGGTNSFDLTLRGDYKVYYYCYDEVGNAALTYYYIRVK